ncbi:FxsA family protein [Paenibacillus sp. GCM10023252]|uniref:FxsA family protein n=1 Tax=Paenibacillus sp. GCM10023252 TaxID=3252649 RepID=UPI00360D8B2A
MYKWLLAAFLIIPTIELWGILQVGDWLGGWTTFLILILISVTGAYLSLAEGRKVWASAQLQMQQGQIPGRTMLDGLCILVGGILLLFPGFITDLIGITFLFPGTRPVYRGLMLKWLERKMRGGGGGGFTIRRT